MSTATKIWRRHVDAARGAAATGAPYVEVRYEALRSNGPAMIGELLEFCGLASEPHMIKTLIGQNAMGAFPGHGEHCLRR